MAVVIAPSRNRTLQAAYAILRGEKGRKPPQKADLAHPKEEPTKPGKRTPTKLEAAWMDAIVRWGCVACRIDGVPPRPPAVHHLLSGGQRIGHLSSIGLCDPGHHQGGKPLGMVSRHPDKAAFEKKYGTEKQLLARTRKELKKQPDGTFAPAGGWKS